MKLNSYCFHELKMIIFYWGYALLILAHLSRRLGEVLVWHDPVSVIVRRPHFQRSISLQLVGRSWLSFIWSIIWQGERQHNVFGPIRLELWLPWQHIAPIDLTWEKSCHHSSSFNYFQIVFILADNEDRYNILIKFDFQLNLELRALEF